MVPSAARLSADRRGRRPPPAALIAALLVVAASFVAYWLSNRLFDAYRGDLFYLADAFLHGRTDIDVQLGPWDVIILDGRIYVPFPPFPAILLMPLVAVTGPVVADQWESGINALIAAIDVGLAWWVAGRIGVERLRDRFALVLLLGFSTAVWWVTTRGGVWHTGHLVATMLLLLLLGELWGRRRAVVFGLLIGAAFLTRPPLAFVAPVFALWVLAPTLRERGRPAAAWVRELPWREWVSLAIGLLPAVLFFLFYNLVRFGSLTESGYALALLPDWLALRRDQGLFSLVHVPMNLDLLFLELPGPKADFPWFQPDGNGMSVFFTSPGLLLAALAPWRRDSRAWLLLGAAIAALIPTLLYYGGGWLQYGYRYFLDSIPFVWALCAMAIAARRTVGWLGWAVVLFGVAINAAGVYWAYHL
jgi:hypothetical protein